MEDQIKRKLRELLLRGITEQEEVVYFLVQARKLMDRESWLMDDTLRMYANWALHIDLSKPSRATHKLLNAFEREYVEENVHGRSWRKTRYETLDVFRSAIRAFLTRTGLPFELVSDDERWYIFAVTYSHTVSDCPISLESPKVTQKSGAYLGWAAVFGGRTYADGH